ncbi:dynamin family protein [Purpureocillium lilacinum]|uniref:Dynamin family protein n=1 Tax=Purpureocillium lilacinum TaxID=33203 RepID=A0A179HX57_PURLI|nr:dynamin family protein [Purpureocillium lilacinum]OAQ95105.1 dynamin family protein [Purpureocillium lilacinum]
MAAVNLQSQAHRDLLDIIDRLRLEGISRYVDLPEIIVTGDQSAGKSSVLEAISGMTFPTKDNLCTRFATELILRRAPHVDVKVSITPDSDRPNHEKEDLKKFQPPLETSGSGLGFVIEEAKEAMGLNGGKKSFSNDILRVELSGPEQPHLTMVDLPGLFQAGNSTQSDEDAELVTRMVIRYMRRPRSIILAVVSAKSDFALQAVTRHARELDPAGSRTLGLITKPDTLDRGSESEAAYVHLAQNKDVKFRLGWHLLKNRDFNTREATTTERDAAEEAFFSQSPWTVIDPLHLGVATLRPRLSNVLKDQILAQLPSLLMDVSEGIKDCKAKLDRLGAPRGTVHEQRRYLFQMSQSYSRLMKAAVDGIYSNAFFGSAKTEEGYQRRLRAVVQNTLIAFRDRMNKEGHRRRIVDFENEGRDSDNPPEVLRSDYVKEVRDLIRRSRGRELPGTFDPMVIGELFAEQSQPWRGILLELKDETLNAVYRTSTEILQHVAVEETAQNILRVVNSGIEELKQDLEAAFEQVLHPYQALHPITYNHYLTETVKKIQRERREQRIRAHVRAIYRVELQGSCRLGLDSDKLLELLALEDKDEMDSELVGSTTAVDYMEAYYKVALKTVVDNVSTHAVECRLIQKLPSILDTEKIHDMGDLEVTQLAADNEASVHERSRTNEKLSVLEKALSELKQLDGFRSIVAEAQIPSKVNGEATRSSAVPPRSESLRSVREEEAESQSLQSPVAEEYLVEIAPAYAPEPEPPVETYEDEVPVEYPAREPDDFFSGLSSSKKKKKKGMKVFMTRRDVLDSQHEPFGDAFYYGPEFLSDRYRDDPATRAAHPQSDQTYKSILDHFAEVEKQGKRVFIKDMAYYLFPPEGQPTKIAESLGGGEEPGNPTVIPLDILRKFHFTFLIRHPRRSIPSYYRCVIPPLNEITGWNDFMPSETGYEELVRLFDYLIEQGIVDKDHLTVLDADDLLDKPEAMIKLYCERTGIEFDPKMLVWDQEDKEHAAKLFAKWNGFHDDVLGTDRLMARTHAQKTSTVESENKEWTDKYGPEAQKLIRELVDANIPHYDYLKQFCLKV